MVARFEAAAIITIAGGGAIEGAHAREGDKRNRVEYEQRATLLLLFACPLRLYCTGSCHCTPRFHLLPKMAPSNRRCG